MPEKNTWKPIGEVVEDLRRKSAMWFDLGHFELSETYHDWANDVAIAEWLLEMREDLEK